ncbi:MAG: hypothetical protein ACUVS5_14665, partial [Anaerolineae bacterium]
MAEGGPVRPQRQRLGFPQGLAPGSARTEGAASPWGDLAAAMQCIGEAVARFLEVEEAVQEVLEELRAHLPSAAMAVYITDAETGDLLLRIGEEPRGGAPLVRREADSPPRPTLILPLKASDATVGVLKVWALQG